MKERTFCSQVGNVNVIVSSGRRQPMDDGIFRVCGLAYEDMNVVALKSSQHFKAWWASRSRGIVPCDSPGIHCADLSVFDFKYANTGYYPLGDAEWSEQQTRIL